MVNVANAFKINERYVNVLQCVVSIMLFFTCHALMPACHSFRY